MPRPWNLAPPRARRASGAHLLAPPALGPRAAPPPRLLPTRRRPGVPGLAARRPRGHAARGCTGALGGSWPQGEGTPPSSGRAQREKRPATGRGRRGHGGRGWHPRCRS